MARITVEDCEGIVKNRFDLVLFAVQRTRQIISGEKVTVADSKEEKKPVIALREIAAKTVSIESLKEEAIKSFRTFLPKEEEEEDLEDFAAVDTYNPYIGIEVKSIEDEEKLTAEEMEDNAQEESTEGEENNLP